MTYQGPQWSEKVLLFLSWWVFFDWLGITISKLMILCEDTRRYKHGERFSIFLLFSWSHASASTCIVVYMCSIMAPLHHNDMENLPRKRGHPYKNPKVLSIDKIINPDNSTQLKTIKTPRKLMTRCLKVWHLTSWFYRRIQMIVIQQFVHSTSLFCISLQPSRIVSTWRQ